MKIGEAHRTQSSSLYFANTIGAPMYPAPKIIGALCLVSNAYWRGGHRSANILAHRGPLRQYIGAPMSPAPLLNVIILNRQCGGIIKILKKEADQTVRCASPIFKPIAY
jgi:hypothetical protein